jgi:hypothetical protein
MAESDGQALLGANSTRKHSPTENRTNYIKWLCGNLVIPTGQFHVNICISIPNNSRTWTEALHCVEIRKAKFPREGHNLEFCHVMLNYDLPWNPMEIEQRIGRLHRIGQEKEVQVYHFCIGGSIEDHILQVLDKKINMFELVVGEIDMILGRLHH